MAGVKGKSGGARANTGGARKGAGRKPMHGGQAMQHSTFVKLTAEQHAALVRHCERLGIKLAFFLRESALAQIGRPDLGVAGKTKELQALTKKMGLARAT